MLIKWIVTGAVATAASATLATARVQRAPEGTGTNDLAQVNLVLEGMRGTAPIPCGLALTVLDGRNGWGWSHDEVQSGTDSTVGELRHWASEGIKDPAVVPILRSAIGPGDQCVRESAARLLGRTEHPRAVAALTEALRDTSAETRRLAALALGLGDSKGAFDPLVAALRDQEPRVRATAAISLGRLGDDRASKALLPLLTSDRVPSVRRAAAYALGDLD
jgi:HEAT repeat protein